MTSHATKIALQKKNKSKKERKKWIGYLYEDVIPLHFASLPVPYHWHFQHSVFPLP